MGCCASAPKDEVQDFAKVPSTRVVEVDQQDLEQSHKRAITQTTPAKKAAYDAPASPASTSDYVDDLGPPPRRATTSYSAQPPEKSNVLETPKQNAKPRTPRGAEVMRGNSRSVRSLRAGDISDIKIDEGGRLQRFPGNVGILVTDMSGFTKLTKVHGITHFGSLIIRMRQLCYPVINKYNPLSVETEADDFFVVFRSPVDAAKAAYEMWRTAEAYNKTVTQDHFRIHFGGMGIDAGHAIQELATGKALGEAADGAFELGENLSEKEILISARALKELKDHKDFAECQFPERKPGADDNVIDALGCGWHAMLGTVKLSHPIVCAPFDDTTYIGDGLRLLALRASEKADTKDLEQQVDSLYLTEESTAIMFGLKVEELTFAHGIMHAITVKQQVLELLHDNVRKNNGLAVEPFLIIFAHSADAVACALDMRRTLAEYNSKQPENEQLKPKGFGVHASRMLIVPGSNVHWGDAVSTASKLGEDLAQDGEVLISDIVHQHVAGEPRFASVNFEKRQLETSGVKFTCYALSHAQRSASLMPGALARASLNLGPSAGAGSSGAGSSPSVAASGKLAASSSSVATETKLNGTTPAAAASMFQGAPIAHTHSLHGTLPGKAAVHPKSPAMGSRDAGASRAPSGAAPKSHPFSIPDDESLESESL